MTGEVPDNKVVNLAEERLRRRGIRRTEENVLVVENASLQHVCERLAVEDELGFVCSAFTYITGKEIDSPQEGETWDDIVKLHSTKDQDVLVSVLEWYKKAIKQTISVETLKQLIETFRGLYGRYLTSD